MAKLTKTELEKSNYWADQIVKKIISEQGLKETYNIAAGITPSGVIHIGNFREVITNDIIKRALEDQNFKVNFYYSWDDYDRYRKIPKNLPRQEELKQEIGKPVSKIFDPYNCHKNYSEHFEKKFEKEIEPLNIKPKYIYENEKYLSCEYAEEVKKVLQEENLKKIKKILDKYRKEPLSNSWIPLQIYCKNCQKDNTKVLSYDKEYTITYYCNNCKKEEKTNFKKEGNIKLAWRVDWPMRWHYFDIHFEPGGKDHSTVGGSYDTGKEIVKEIWNKKAPSYLMYDFVIPKGEGGKISSSKGNVITVEETLKIYTPEILRYIFSGSRPGSEISIPFDENVIKIYEDFDRIEKIYYEKEEKENITEKEKINSYRIYEMSITDNKNISEKMLYQPKFRELTILTQIYENKKELILKYYENKIENLTEKDKKRIIERSIRAYNWVKTFAPEQYKFKLNKVEEINIEEYKKKFTIEEKELLKKIVENINLKEEELGLIMKETMKEKNITPKEFFKKTYNLLLNSDRGPKLTSFIKMMPEKTTKLFKKITE